MNLYPFVQLFDDRLRATHLVVNVIAPDADTAWSMVLREHGGPESHWECKIDEARPVLLSKIYEFDRLSYGDKVPASGVYTVVIVAINEAQAWETLLAGHGGDKSQWAITEHFLLPGEVVAAIE